MHGPKKSPNKYHKQHDAGDEVVPVLFGPFGKLIVQSLPIGVIAFDLDLKIIEANVGAAKLIELDNFIDKSFARGTESPDVIGFDWTKQLKSVVTTGKTREFESIHYKRDGKTRLLQVVCSPIKIPETAQILGGTVVIEDITEKVNIQRQLANAERMATVGKLASKVAHELNNPMDGILRYINLAMRIIEQKNLEKPREYLTQCRQGLMRMVQIVSELLEFSRTTYVSMKYVEIEQIIEDAIRTMEARAEACNIRISLNYDCNIPKIIDGGLFQVFCNLIKNAVEAMPNGGELNISTRLSDNNTAIVEFHDTGDGLPTEYSDVIFEPFFTTKEGGTGLGLAICKDIVERYHGRITAENASKKGSIFTVYLPIETSSSVNT